MGVGCVFSSRRRQTRCVLVTGVQTCAIPICWCSDPCRRWEGRSATDAAPGRKAGRNHRRPKCVRREEGGLWASSTVLPRRFCGAAINFPALLLADSLDRKSVVSGKSVSVSVDLGGRRILKKKKELQQKQ